MTESCDVSPGELIAYRAGDLPPARMAAAEAHLAGCPACRERLAGFDEVDRLMRAADPQMYGDAHAGQAAVVAGVRRELGRRVRPDWWRVLLVVLPLKLGLFVVARRARDGSPAQLAAGASIAAATVLAVRQLLARVPAAGPRAPEQGCPRRSAE